MVCNVARLSEYDMWIQKEVSLKPRPRGFHLITNELQAAVPELNQIEIGTLHVIIQHTSASLSLNENADPTVRMDFESVFSRLVPEGEPYYRHVDEGDDDLPAHIKASLLGASITIPITRGRMNLGTWQGIYLGEHRNHGGSRRLLITANGQAVV